MKIKIYHNLMKHKVKKNHQLTILIKINNKIQI